MCGDLTDPSSDYRSPVLNFYGPQFGFNPAAVGPNLADTSTVVSEVVVTAPSRGGGIVIMPPETITLQDFNDRFINTSIPPLDIQQVPDPSAGIQFHLMTQPTPCIQKIPAGVSLQALNDLVYSESLGLQYKAMNTGFEWGVTILLLSDGTLSPTMPYTRKDSTALDVVVPVPAGARIVATVHTHPYGANGFQNIPSDQSQGKDSDETRAYTIAADTAHGTPNLVSYIVTPNTSARNSFTVRAYDIDNMHLPNDGCVLSW